MTASLSLLLLLLASASSRVHGDCEFQIRRSRVLSTWQSSFDDGPTCFYNRSHSDEESTLSNRTPSYRFFHSANRLQADGGFHWFAVQLSETVLIRSVTVKGREDSLSFVFERARGIEIWTSGSSSQMFSGDHCSSRNMNRQFNESQQLWRQCGVTESRQSVIRAGENFTVNCVAEVRQLLLRRDIRAANVSSYHDFMSFADLRLQTVQLEPSVPQLVAENSGFTVSCSLHCGGQPSTNSSQLRLCFPNGSCVAEQDVRIPRAQPEHSGKYTCRLGSVEKPTAVSVLSSSMPQEVVKNSSFTVSCSLHCNGSDLCSNPSGLQLCLPNGSCSADRKLAVAVALPLHSGKYTCRLGSVETRTSVTVLYPPCVVSISFINFESCQSPSDVIVQFASSASCPVSEHRCSADTGGRKLLNLTRLSQISGGDGGSVSLWKLDRDGELRSAGVTCTAVQTLPDGVEFKAVRSDRALLSCSARPLQGCRDKNGVIFAAVAFVSGFIASTSILCVLLRVSVFRSLCSSAAADIQEPSRTERVFKMVRQGGGSTADGGPAAGTTGAADAAAEYENSEYKLENAAGVYVG